MAAHIFDALDEIRRHAEAAVGENGIACQQLQGSDRAGTERHGEIGRILGCVKTEFGNVILGILRSDGLQNANGNQVLGFGQGVSHAHGAIEPALVILGCPGCSTGLGRIDDQGCIVDDGRRSKTLFQGGGIYEWFKAGAGLAPGLGNMVELAVVEVEPADQRINGAIARARRNKCSLCLGYLCDFPCAFCILPDTNN